MGAMVCMEFGHDHNSSAWSLDTVVYRNFCILIGPENDRF